MGYLYRPVNTADNSVGQKIRGSRLYKVKRCLTTLYFVDKLRENVQKHGIEVVEAYPFFRELPLGARQ